MHLRPSVSPWASWSENEVCSGALLARCYFEATKNDCAIDQLNLGHVQPGQNGGKRLLNGNGGALNTLFWWRKCCNYGSWEGHSLCSFWRIFEAWWNGYINTCLILQNTLDVTVTALAVQNKREHPNRVKGFVETVVPNYCDPIFASHFRIKRQTFQMKDNPLLTYETVLWSIWPYYFYRWVLGLSLLLITVVVLWYCNIYHYIIRGA